MGTLVKNIVQSSVVESIKLKHCLTNAELADSIGVHPSHIQKVSRQVRTLTKNKFDLLCSRWNVNISDIEQKLQLDQDEYLQQKAIVKFMRARQIDLKELSDRSGISTLDLNYILRGKRAPTKEEVKKVADVFQVDVGVIEEWRVEIVIKIIRTCLEAILFEPSSIQAVIDFIEMDI